MSSSTTPYEPHATSLAGKVLAYFRQHRDEELSAADIAIKYDTNVSEVPALLASAVTHLLLSVQSHRKNGVPGKLYSPGPALKAEASRAAAPAPASAWPAAAKPKPSPQLGKRLPPLDISKLQVQTGQPMPARRGTQGQSRWGPLFAKLTQPDTSVDLPVAYKSAVAKARDVWVKAHPGQKFSVARLPDTELCRVKRTA